MAPTAPAAPGTSAASRAAPPPPPPRRRRGRRPAAFLAALAALGGIAWLVADSAPVRERLGAELARALEARIPGARVQGDVRVRWNLEVVAGPIVVAGSAGAAPVVRVERASVRLRPAALLRGHVQAGVVRLDGVVVEAGVRGAEVARLADALRSRRRGARVEGSGAPAPLPELRMSRVHVRLPLARGPRAAVIELAVASGRVRVEREAEGSSARVALRLEGGGDVQVELDAAGGAPSLRVRAEGVSARALPAALRARLPFAIDDGALSLRAEAPALEEGGRRGEARVELAAEHVALRGPRLASSAVGPLAGRASGTVRWDAGARTVRIAGGRLELGPGHGVGVDAEGELALRPEPRLELRLRAAVDWESLVAALPPALAPPGGAPGAKGELRARLAVAGPLRDRAAWRVEGELDPSDLEAAPRRGALPLDRAFTWEAPLPGGGTRPVVIGPANPSFVPLGALPPVVVRAVTTSEDAGFFGHRGFDLAEVQDALARAGGERRLRGASTITQQLAKNLFLSSERTLARKVREALATIALEAALPKRRLLEIYLNLAEWGPGVYGIGEAARHWFGKDARDLRPKEAAFLATVIPNPVRYEMYRRRGALTERWEERVRGLLRKLADAGALTPEELQEAWTAPLAFAEGGARR